MPEYRVNSKGIRLHSRKHAVDPDLPEHWTGISHGQSVSEREAAILRNIVSDQALKRRGLDPAALAQRGATPPMSAQAAMLKVQSLRR